MKTILVTGGAGFVGSHLALALKARYGTEARVVGLDNLRRRGAELNLPRLRAGGVDFLHGDVRNPQDLDEVGHVHLVVECSAEPSVLAGYDGSPRYLIDTNLTGVVNCLELARRCEAGFLFLSTSRVYPLATIRGLNYIEEATRFELAPDQDTSGVSPAGFSEDFPLAGPRSLYGATKLAAELLISEYLEMYGLPGVINRCGVLTGPWQMGKADQGVMVLWAARHVYGGALKYIGYGGTGKQVRDLLHIDDLADLVLLQVARLDQLSGQTFNVGGGREVSVSLQELTRLCQEASGHTIPIEPEPDDRPADIPLYLSDHHAVSAATGWQPQRSAAETVRDIVRWLVDNEAALRPVLS